MAWHGMDEGFEQFVAFTTHTHTLHETLCMKRRKGAESRKQRRRGCGQRASVWMEGGGVGDGEARRGERKHCMATNCPSNVRPGVWWIELYIHRE